MSAISRVLVVPLVGPFHTRFPRYNAVDVLDAVRASGVRALALAPLAPGALREPNWRATDELALPLALVPWAERAGVALHEVGAAPGDGSVPGEPEDELRFAALLNQFEAGQERLRRVQLAQAPVEELLRGGLDLARVQRELIPAVAAYQRARAEEFEEGPGTGWAAARGAAVAERLLALPHERVALVAGVDELPPIVAALAGRVELEDLAAAPEPSEEARARALLDAAMRGGAEDPATLLGALRGLATPEAGYLAANVLLEHGHLAEALEALEGVLRTDFQEPYYLPGFLLARLGQVYDLAGRREEALRSYRGVLALSFVPPEAAEAAREGLSAPFGAPQEPGSGGGAAG